MKFGEIIESLGYEEIAKLKRDLDHGGIGIRRLVYEKAREMELVHEKKCYNCGNIINNLSDAAFTIIYSYQCRRKKLSFCAKDCFIYFIENSEIENIIKN